MSSADTQIGTDYNFNLKVSARLLEQLAAVAAVNRIIQHLPHYRKVSDYGRFKAF